MTKILVEVSDDIAKKFEGQDVVRIDDILDYQDEQWDSISINEEAGVVLDFLKTINN